MCTVIFGSFDGKGNRILGLVASRGHGCAACRFDGHVWSSAQFADVDKATSSTYDVGKTWLNNNKNHPQVITFL